MGLRFLVFQCVNVDLHFYLLNDAVFESILCSKRIIFTNGTLFNVVMKYINIYKEKGNNSFLSGFGEGEVCVWMCVCVCVDV